MVSSRLVGGYLRRGLTLSVMAGVMLSLFAMRVSAQTDSTSVVAKSNPFAWYAHAELDANYVWRGLYCGGLSLQAEAEVSYYGFFLGSWCNVGTTNWWADRDAAGRWRTGLNPEVDVLLGYRYKGLMLMFIHMYYFDTYADGTRSRYFDWRNYAPGGGGVTTEWRIAYRISDKVPLRLLWCTRTFGRDGYMQNGELRRAYSTYIEASYAQPLPHDITLSAVVGVTPWKSMYTGFEKEFAVVNLSIGLRKQWQLTDYCSMDIGGCFVFNPSLMQPLWNISTGVTFD